MGNSSVKCWSTAHTHNQSINQSKQSSLVQLNRKDSFLFYFIFGGQGSLAPLQYEGQLFPKPNSLLFLQLFAANYILALNTNIYFVQEGEKRIPGSFVGK